MSDRAISQQAEDNLRRIAKHTIATGESPIFTPTGIRSVGLNISVDLSNLHPQISNLCTEITLDSHQVESEDKISS